MLDKLTIGQLAKAAQVNVTTIRYYERRGLLLPDKRSDTHYRLYSNDTKNKLHFIKKAQQLGFTLDEIKELLELQANQHQLHCATMKAKASHKLTVIDNKIQELKKIKRALKKLHDRCQEDEPLTQCPIIQMLSELDIEEENES